MKRKFISGSNEQLGDRQVRVIASTGTVDRMGEVVDPAGIDFSNFLTNPVVLWQHDPDQPIGRASNVCVVGSNLHADIEFAPAGTSPKADEICGLVKARILNGLSIGFDPVETVPMSASKPRGPQKYTAIDLMEMSIVSIPANIQAAVVQRAFPRIVRTGKTISAATRAKLEAALEYQAQGIKKMDQAEALFKKFADEINKLIESGDLDAEPDDISTGKAAVPLTREKRMCEVAKLRPGHLAGYPQALRGDTPAHYAARANYDEARFRERHRAS